ncbi:MAG: hypothetical protein ABI791_06060 [Acidobacteriota bacterium]
MQYPRRKKPRKISDAVFRGKKSAYSFQVFPIAADIDDTPAVFIIARRRTDKLGHGHQSAVCIGETSSITSELKKHKRAKCVKNNEPNVICVMEEENAAVRARVLEDLIAARKFGCIQNVYDFTIKPKSYERPKASRPAKRIVPEIVVDKKPVPTNSRATQPTAKKAVATGKSAKPEKKNKSDLRTVTAKPSKPARAKAAKSPARQAVVAPVVAKRKPSATAVRSKIKLASSAKKPLLKAVPATRAKSSRPTPVPAAKRSSAERLAGSKQLVVKRQPAVKPKSSPAKTVKKGTTVRSKTVVSKRGKAAAAKKATTTKAKPTVKSKTPAKRAAAAGTRSRVSSGVDSNGRQHRLSKPEKPVGKRAKSRTDSKPGTRRKAAA